MTDTRYCVEAVFAVGMVSLRNIGSQEGRVIQVDDEELYLTPDALGMELQMNLYASSMTTAVRDAVAAFRATLREMMVEPPVSLPYPIKVSATEVEPYFEAVARAPIHDLDKVA